MQVKFVSTCQDRDRQNAMHAINQVRNYSHSPKLGSVYANTRLTTGAAPYLILFFRLYARSLVFYVDAEQGTTHRLNTNIELLSKINHSLTCSPLYIVLQINP